MPKSTQEHEVRIIGGDFSPGAQANSEIDYLLGHNTHMLDDVAIRSEAFGCSFAPNYCEDIEITTSELENLGLQLLILPSIDFERFKRNLDSSPMFTATFIFNGEYHVTIPFETAELAHACALWYVLAYLT